MIQCRAGANNWYQLTVDTRLPLPALGITFHHTNMQTVTTFQSAADRAAMLINSRCNNLYLAMSGGLDSEFVAEVLYRNKISFTPIIAVLPDNIECHYAMHWCAVHDLTPVIINIEPNDPHLVRQFLLIAKTLNQATGLSNLMPYLSEYVSGKNGQLLVGDSPLGGPTDNYYQESGDIFDIVWYSFIIELMQPGMHPGAFFQYTPELMLAQATSLNTKLSECAGKAVLYQIPFRPKTRNHRCPLDGAMINKLSTFANVSESSRFPDIRWHKEELIQLLLR